MSEHTSCNPFRELLEFGLRMHREHLRLVDAPRERVTVWGPRFKAQEAELQRLKRDAFGPALDVTGFGVPEGARRVNAFVEPVLAIILWMRDAPRLTPEEIGQLNVTCNYRNPTADYLSLHYRNMVAAWGGVEELATRWEGKAKGEKLPCDNITIIDSVDSPNGIEPATESGYASVLAQTSQPLALDAGRIVAGSLTSEELVKRYLAEAVDPQRDDAIAKTCLSRHQIEKTEAWKEHESKLLTEFLQDKPNATLANVSAKFYWSSTKISGMTPWRELKQKKDARKSLAIGKERQLNEISLNTRSPEDEVDFTINVHESIDREDALWRKLVELADVDTKPRLFKLQPADKTRMLKNILEQTPTEADLSPEILIELVQTWLEDEQQARRRRSRRDNLR